MAVKQAQENNFGAICHCKGRGGEFELQVLRFVWGSVPGRKCMAQSKSLPVIASQGVRDQ